MCRRTEKVLISALNTKKCFKEESTQFQCFLSNQIDFSCFVIQDVMYTKIFNNN